MLNTVSVSLIPGVGISKEIVNLERTRRKVHFGVREGGDSRRGTTTTFDPNGLGEPGTGSEGTPMSRVTRPEIGEVWMQCCHYQ